MPKVDPDALPVHTGPDRASGILGDLGPYEGRAISGTFGLGTLGANLETLPPGSASSHRHWHERVDEIVVVLEGELTLVEERCETPMVAGDVAVFPAGMANGHCLRNDSSAPARFFVVGSNDPADRCHYAAADLVGEADGSLRRADGSLAAPSGEAAE